MWTPAWTNGRGRRSLASAALLLALLAFPAASRAAAPDCLVAASHHAPAAVPALRFGIYPGGPAGSVHPTAAPRPENPTRRLAALRTLAGASPFVVRLYSGWTGDADADDLSGWLDGEIEEYTAAGLLVELVIRYKPVEPGSGSPAEFASWVRSVVRRYGANERFISLQVTNEANIPGAPGASDGAFTGASEALVSGVIAAKQQARGDGREQLRIGFSWAYDERPLASSAFWAELGRRGGRTFADAVDWVGLDSYPGTWAPQIALSSLLPSSAAVAVREGMRVLRDCLMPLAGLGARSTLHIAENGFPTGPGRSPELQARTLAAMVRSIEAVRARYGVTDYRWFDLRDSSSADRSVESQYGITYDDYAPKPAFETYRELVASAGRGRGPSVPSRPPTCRRSPVRIALPRWRQGRVTSLVVRVQGRVVRRVRTRRLPRAVRVSVRSGRAKIRVRISARGRVARVVGRTYRVC